MHPDTYNSVKTTELNTKFLTSPLQRTNEDLKAIILPFDKQFKINKKPKTEVK